MRPLPYDGAVHVSGQAESPAAPAFAIRYVVSFDGALEAGRLFHARFYRQYMVALVVALVAGVAITPFYPVFGLPIVFCDAVLLLMARFAVMDRMFGRRQLRSLIGGTTELALSEEGIAFSGPLSFGHIPWTSITEVRANGRTVLFVGDRLPLAYAPATAFATPEEMAAVVAYSSRQVAAAKAGGPTSSPQLGTTRSG